jgi:hypothetical protein
MRAAARRLLDVRRMRRTERIAVDLAVTWTRGGRTLECRANDVNAHGMFIRTSELVEPGSLMHLAVTLPDHTIDMYVTARFVGRTISGQGIGCEIFLIDDASQGHWIAYYEDLVASVARQRELAAAAR